MTQARVAKHDANQSPEGYSSRSNRSPFSLGSASSYLFGLSPDSFISVLLGDMTSPWTAMPAENFAVLTQPTLLLHGNW